MSVFGRKRHVVVHLKHNEGSVEGIQLGRRPIGGHYILLNAKVQTKVDQSVTVDGPIEIPRENVLLVQPLTPLHVAHLA